MATKGQLFESHAAYTPIELLAPEWIKHWTGPPTCTAIDQLGPVSTYFVVVTQSFVRSFSRQASVPRFRFEYCSNADEVADQAMLYFHQFGQTPVDLREEPLARDEAVEPVDPVLLIERILEWLRITYDELADITGVSRSALFYWKKTGATPRAANVRPLLQLYSFTSILVRRYGKEGARKWLQSQGREAWEFLIRGDISSAEDVMRRYLFSQPSHPSRGGRSLVQEVDFSGGIGTGAPTRRAERRPKKGRSGSS